MAEVVYRCIVPKVEVPLISERNTHSDSYYLCHFYQIEALREPLMYFGSKLVIVLLFISLLKYEDHLHRTGAALQSSSSDLQYSRFHVHTMEHTE